MQNLSLIHQVLDRSSNVFDRHFRIDAMLNVVFCEELLSLHLLVERMRLELVHSGHHFIMDNEVDDLYSIRTLELITYFVISC